MMRSLSLLTVLAASLVGCDSASDTALLDKSDVAAGGKSDGAADYCAQLGKPAGCDVCEEMGWYDDGACDQFCKRPDPDCPAIPGEISTHLSGDAPQIHPTLGVWIVHKPGLFPSAAWFPTAAAVRSSNVSFALDPMTCSIHHGVSLVDRCEETASPTTCMLSSGEGASPVSHAFDVLEMQDLSTASPETRERARASETLIQHRIENDGAYIDFYYGEIEGKVYLLVVDASDDCSA